jgi:hypothetical protein
MKMPSKSLVMFIKSSLKPLNLYKSLTFLNKSLHFFENEFKKPQNLSKRPTSYINVKTFVYLEIIKKSLEYLENPYITSKKPQFH